MQEIEDRIESVPNQVADSMRDTYAALTAEFEETFSDTRGGVTLTYITGEQVTTRLNEALGVGNWSFTIVEHGVNEMADEAWVLGELRARISREWVVRQQFGSQKIKRRRNDKSIVEIGFDLKGAATDALKKCASLVGVGLYLSKREQHAHTDDDAGDANAGFSGDIVGCDYQCDECGRTLQATSFRDGKVWSPETLATYGRRKHKRVLCMDHYRAANELRKRAEQSMDDVPF